MWWFEPLQKTLWDQRQGPSFVLWRLLDFVGVCFGGCFNQGCKPETIAFKFFEGVSKGLDLGLSRFGDFNTCRENNKITSNRLDLVSEICMMVRMAQTPQQ